MSWILTVYHEIRNDDVWAFAGEMEFTDEYGLPAEPEVGALSPVALYTGYESQLWWLLGIPSHRDLLPPAPTFPARGLPADLSAILRHEAGGERAANTITVRALSR
jgi:hypothetical protein